MLQSRTMSEPFPPSFRNADLFAELTDESLSTIFAAFRHQPFKQHEILFHQGDPAGRFHLIDAGEVKVVQTSPAGDEVILHLASAGHLIGALAMLSGGTYPASGIALNDGAAYTVTAEAFDQLTGQHPEITRNLLRFATRQLQIAHRRLRELATERVERRIARTLARLARQLGRAHEGGVLLNTPLSRQDLAELCGTTLFTVSRTLKAWEREGLIRAERQQVVILDPHRFTIFAEDLPEDDPLNRP